MHTNIIDHILKLYQDYLNSSYHTSKLTFFKWLDAVEGLDYYKNEVRTFKNLLYV